MVRQRGPGWGKKKTQQPRVEWHELKTGVFYLQEQAARKNGRGLLSDKVVVSWQGEPLELGRRLHQAACEHGLGRANKSWWSAMARRGFGTWRKTAGPARWRCWIFITPASMCGLGEAVIGERQAARPWVEQQLHQLRHGRHAAALKTIAGLKAGRGAAGEIIRREQNYFAGHAARMNYRAVADRGWPIGSGPVESACLQRQGRFKRSGQSWTPLGLRHLCALIEARQNGVRPGIPLRLGQRNISCVPLAIHHPSRTVGRLRPVSIAAHFPSRDSGKPGRTLARQSRLKKIPGNKSAPRVARLATPFVGFKCTHGGGVLLPSRSRCRAGEMERSEGRAHHRRRAAKSERQSFTGV